MDKVKVVAVDLNRSLAVTVDKKDIAAFDSQYSSKGCVFTGLIDPTSLVHLGFCHPFHVTLGVEVGDGEGSKIPQDIKKTLLLSFNSPTRKEQKPNKKRGVSNATDISYIRIYNCMFVRKPKYGFRARYRNSVIGKNFS